MLTIIIIIIVSPTAYASCRILYSLELKQFTLYVFISGNGTQKNDFRWQAKMVKALAFYSL